jgi:general secretion pathway protein F
MRFQVRALSPDNLIETHTVDAADASEAGRLLLQRRLQPLSIKAAGGVAAESTGFSGRSTFSLLLFSAELLALLEAGLSLVEAFEALLEKEASPVSRGVLERLTADLREGLRFSAALARQPSVFPALYVGIVRAAEGTSDLPRALSRYIDYQTRLDTVRNRMLSAAIYPAILLIVGGGVTFFLMGYVVPRFAGVYQGSGRSLAVAVATAPRLGTVRRPALRTRIRLRAGRAARRWLLAAPFRPQRSLDRRPDPFARDR